MSYSVWPGVSFEFLFDSKLFLVSDLVWSRFNLDFDFYLGFSFGFDLAGFLCFIYIINVVSQMSYHILRPWFYFYTIKAIWNLALQPPTTSVILITSYFEDLLKSEVVLYYIIPYLNQKSILTLTPFTISLYFFSLKETISLKDFKGKPSKTTKIKIRTFKTLINYIHSLQGISKTEKNRNEHSTLFPSCCYLYMGFHLWYILLSFEIFN